MLGLTLRLAATAAICSLTTAVNVSPAAGFTSSDGAVTFALNIPQNETNTDIYFTMTGPSSSSWIAVGMGNDKMDGSLIFMAYKNSTADGITLSPRLATGENEPSWAHAVDAELLPGSGITNDNYNVFVLCHNCRSWGLAATALNVNNKAGKFIFAAGPDGSLNDNSVSANTQRHSSYGTFTMDMTTAQGIRGPPNPATADSTGTVQTQDKADHNYQGAFHAILMILAFVGLMPIGLLILRLLNSVKLHGLNQAFSLLVALIGTFLGIYASTMYNRTKHFNSAHQVFGLIIIVAMIAQFVLGFLHHRIYTKTQATTKLAPVHVWLGRIVIPAGIANGFLGFPLALNYKYNWVLVALVLLVIVVLGPFAFWAWKRNQAKKRNAVLDGQLGSGYQSQPWAAAPSRSDIHLNQYQSEGQSYPPAYPQSYQAPTPSRPFP